MCHSAFRLSLQFKKVICSLTITGYFVGNHYQTERSIFKESHNSENREMWPFYLSLKILGIEKMNFRSATIVLMAVIINNCGTGAYAETQWRLGANITSYHIAATKEFNEFNPGAFVSVSFNVEKRFQYGLQIGGFLNSYSERTLYGLGFVNYRIKQYEDAELFLGGFAGLFEYSNLISQARRAGIPVVGNAVFAAGPSLTYRMRNGVDFTLGFIPFYGRETSGILTIQTSIAFGAP